MKVKHWWILGGTVCSLVIGMSIGISLAPNPNPFDIIELHDFQVVEQEGYNIIPLLTAEQVVSLIDLLEREAMLDLDPAQGDDRWEIMDGNFVLVGSDIPSKPVLPEVPDEPAEMIGELHGLNSVDGSDVPVASIPVDYSEAIIDSLLLSDSEIGATSLPKPVLPDLEADGTNRYTWKAGDGGIDVIKVDHHIVLNPTDDPYVFELGDGTLISLKEGEYWFKLKDGTMITYPVRDWDVIIHDPVHIEKEGQLTIGPPGQMIIYEDNPNSNSTIYLGERIEAVPANRVNILDFEAHLRGDRSYSVEELAGLLIDTKDLRE